MADAALENVLSEIEAKGRDPKTDFFHVWHSIVCNRRRNIHLINQVTFDLARLAFDRGRVQSE